MNKVQFTFKDVVNKFEEIYRLDSQKKKNTLDDIQHTLISPSIGVTGTLNIFSMHDKNDDYSPTIFQKAYSSNIENLVAIIIDNVYSIAKTSYKEVITSSERENVERYSKNIVDKLSIMQEFLPIHPKIIELGKTTDEKIHLIDCADFYVEQFYYNYNLKFSPNFQRDKYNLKQDVKEYAEKYSFKGNNETLFVGIHHEPITKQNYLEHVVIPLINNIHDHAYNLENDIYARNAEYFGKNQKPMSRHVYINSEIDEACKQVIITVNDDGFGISPNMKDRLFIRNASSKTDKTTEHGIGLWAVKNFVEENGGRIWCESEFGKFTKFSFTIPYDRKDIDAYVKD